MYTRLVMLRSGLDLGEQCAGAVNLIDDLAGVEVAAQAELGGGAELTIQSAADLGRDALGELVAVGDEHALDGVVRRG